MIVMRLIFILFTLWCLPGLAQQIAVPELRQQVTDITGTLSTSEQQSLTQQLQDITHKTRAQVAVLVVPSTGDDSIEQYATRFLIAGNWEISRETMVFYFWLPGRIMLFVLRLATGWKGWLPTCKRRRLSGIY